MKIRGCFATRDEASNHAKRLQKDDATFDIYVVDMYKWLLIPPDRDHIEDTHYSEDKLEELMQGYKENQAQAHRMFEQRKRDMVEKPIAEGEEMPYAKAGDENSKYYTKAEEAPISHPADVLEQLKKDHPDKPIEELVKMADEKVAEQMKERQAQRAESAELSETAAAVAAVEAKVEAEAEASATAATGI